ncbi:MAG: toll/interleukin-1 receptor domain-containing protein [Desulfobacterales bacterium]|nr:MAG: toll/interleukin-1 receptor domain-containing protein [Desulfobacterales bacterium]
MWENVHLQVEIDFQLVPNWKQVLTNLIYRYGAAVDRIYEDRQHVLHIVAKAGPAVKRKLEERFPYEARKALEQAQAESSMLLSPDIGNQIKVSVDSSAQIFFSYAREDVEAVKEIYRRLSDAGFKPWMDKIDLLPGQRWQSEIPKALRGSVFVLIFFSRHSVAKRGFVQREFKLALDTLEEIPEGVIHTIPVRLDDCSIPERFSELQWVDHFDQDWRARLVQALEVGLTQRQRSQPEILQPIAEESLASQPGEPQPDTLRSSTTMQRWWCKPTIIATIIGMVTVIAIAIVPIIFKKDTQSILPNSKTQGKESPKQRPLETTPFTDEPSLEDRETEESKVVKIPGQDYESVFAISDLSDSVVLLFQLILLEPLQLQLQLDNEPLCSKGGCDFKKLEPIYDPGRRGPPRIYVVYHFQRPAFELVGKVVHIRALLGIEGYEGGNYSMELMPTRELPPPSELDSPQDLFGPEAERRSFAPRQKRDPRSGVQELSAKILIMERKASS